jgi:site-specific DNA recombinase
MIHPNKSQLKYFIYARKSSESDEKQVQSIDDQVHVMQELARDFNLNVTGIFTESKSAKEPGKRTAFEEMLKRIEKGEAQGIVVWKIDRLSRNPIDSARIQWLLQKEVIQSIQTSGREYQSEDNALILSVESSMANQYIRDLSKNVKRGLKSKLEKGWMPGNVPLGYLNTKTENKGENYIIKDEERFTLLRRAWDLMLTGNYTADEVRNKLNNEWGFRTRKTKKTGGKPISRSTIYRTFTNSFYAGLIDYNHQYFEGKHQPMITVEEFDKVQFQLGRKGKQRPGRHQYAYTGGIRCGECNGVVSATLKEKIIKTTGEYKAYTLYYCINGRKRKCNCTQRSDLNETVIDNTVLNVLESITIHPVIKDWAMQILNESIDIDQLEANKTHETQQKTIQDTEKQLENLTQLRLKEFIDDTEFIQEKTRLKNDLLKLRLNMNTTQSSYQDSVDLTGQIFEFAAYALNSFQNGDCEVKKTIFRTVCSNCTVLDKKALFDIDKSFLPIKNALPMINDKMRTLEPGKTLTVQGYNTLFNQLRPSLRALVDAVRTSIEKHKPNSLIIPLPTPQVERTYGTVV